MFPCTHSCFLMRCEENEEVGAFVKCADGISRPAGRPGHAAGITRAMCLCPHSSAVLTQRYLEPRAASPKTLASPQAPHPVNKGDRPRRWVVSSLPSQPRPGGLGLFPPPLLPTPLGPTLSGERPMAFSVPRECCAGAVGNRPTVLAVGVTGSPTCWPWYWVISAKWAAGLARPFPVL